MKYLAVRNWQKFQHYRERNPVWVKAYVELLDNPDWLALSDAAKGQLFALWLLAAKRGNRIPADPQALRVLLGVTGKLHVQDLIAGGWIEEAEGSVAGALASSPASSPASNSASKVASKRASKTASAGASEAASRDASTSRASARSREGETETEGEAPPPAREASPQVTRFLGALSPSQRVSWQHVLDGWQQGLGYPGGRAADPADIDVGVMEYLAVVDEPQRDYSPRHVVQFVESARIRRVAAPSREGRVRAPDESTAEQAMRVASTLETLAGGQAA